MYQLVIFAHVVSSFLFFLSHGVSAAVALALRRERRLERVRALLELSEASKRIMRPSLFGVLLSGIVGGFMLNWWQMGWIWLSLVLVIVISFGMMAMGTAHFNALRKAVGSPYREGGKQQPGGEPVSAAELDLMLNSPRLLGMTVIGVGGLVVIVYLMMYKPF